MSRTSVLAVVLSLALFASAASADSITGTALPANPLLPWSTGPASTNAANYANPAPRPFVLLHDDSTPGEITLSFNNNAPGVAFFEYRIDGIAAGVNPHAIVAGDTQHPGVFLSANTVTPLLRTFTAQSTVDVRLALGGEADYRFDWTRFEVAPVPLPAAAWGGIALFGLMGAKRIRKRNT